MDWKLVAIYFLVAFLVVAALAFLGLWLWDRRERRRSAVLAVMLKAIEKGVPAEIFDVIGVAKAYVIGNYIGPGSLTEKAWRFTQIMQSDVELFKLFRKLFFNLFQIAVKHDDALKEMLPLLKDNLGRIGASVTGAEDKAAIAALAQPIAQEAVAK
jgi:hypothetical protein